MSPDASGPDEYLPGSDSAGRLAGAFGLPLSDLIRRSESDSLESPEPGAVVGSDRLKDAVVDALPVIAALSAAVDAEFGLMLTRRYREPASDSDSRAHHGIISVFSRRAMESHSHETASMRKDGAVAGMAAGLISQESWRLPEVSESH